MTGLLLLAFLLVPIAEIYVIVQVGEAIGGWQTVVLLLFWSALGAWLVRREGRRAWRALQGAVGIGRLPGREVADGALVLVGGALLLTPGFITDGVGLLLVLPFTRPLARRALSAYAARRAGRSLFGRRATLRTRIYRGPGRPPDRSDAPPPGRPRGPRVIEGERVQRDPTDRPR